MKAEIIEICVNAKAAARKMTSIEPWRKNETFIYLAKLLKDEADNILLANGKDLESAAAEGLDEARIDRLTITEKNVKQMAEACLYLANMPDPVGAMDKQWQRPNGILVGKMRIPLGVIGMIYEARPNVTIDAAILCLKAGNSVILRGGREALHSNTVLEELIVRALEKNGMPKYAAQLIKTVNHEAVDILCKMDEYLDVIIPRGGENLVRKVSEMATMPVLKHYKGVCHAFIDKSANLEMAVKIVINAKTQRPGVCNALEGLLVHEDVADVFLPLLAEKMPNVKFCADEKALPLLGKNVRPLQKNDKGYEFHSLSLLVCIVKNMREALDYISEFGTHHTDIICTENYDNAMQFMREVDSSMVGVNVSTRFNDGGELGLGAEIGISTSKLHSFGPMGVGELTTTKFVVMGNGQIRE